MTEIPGQNAGISRPRNRDFAPRAYTIVRGRTRATMKAWPLLFWLWTFLLLPSQGEKPRVSAFNFIGPSNRLITPNGDMKNDNVVFIFDNPGASDVTARIYDMKGKLVVGKLPPIPGALPCFPACTFEAVYWDGKADGVVVPGGVYVYSIAVESEVFSGSVVVIK